MSKKILQCLDQLGTLHTLIHPFFVVLTKYNFNQQRRLLIVYSSFTMNKRTVFLSYFDIGLHYIALVLEYIIYIICIY